MPTRTAPTQESRLSDEFIEPHRENVLIYYLGDVIDWHGYVKFLSLAALRETSSDVPLERLFVEPAVGREHLLPDALETTSPQLIPLSVALAENQRLVLLGDPGSGKSMAVNWISTALTRGTDSYLARQLGGPLIPLPFVLRELGLGHDFVEVQDPAKRWEQLLQLFLARPVARHLNEERQRHIDFQESILGRMLRSGQALLLMDGIDEIGSVEVREALREAVFEGMRRHPHCRWVLTSRIVGYEEVRFAPEALSSGLGVPPASGSGAKPKDMTVDGSLSSEQLNAISKTIELFYIAPFNDRQVEQFTTLWWKHHESNPHLAATRPAEFLTALKQTHGVRSLARLPHLLTMVALIYRTRAELPDGRALLYSFIADAYLGTLDKERKLEHLRPIPYSVEEMRSWLAAIAWYLQRRRGAQLEGGRLSEGLIDSLELLNLLSETIRPNVGENAHSVAQLFLQYVGRRSGLLLPRGQDSAGREVYAFIHLSFQEYFAALFLRDRVSDPDWRELETENARYGTSLENLRSYAENTLWRETLVFLWESSTLVSPLLPQRLLQRVFDWGRNERLWGEFAVPSTAELESKDVHAEWQAVQRKVLLAAALSVNPHVALTEVGREVLRRRCWKWELLRQDRSWKGKNWESFHNNLVAQTLLSRPTSVTSSADILRLVATEEKIESLSLIRCSALIDPSPIVDIPSLRELFLSSASPTIDLSAIAHLSKLRQLCLLSYTDLSDLSPLRRMSNLEALSISRSNALADISPLGQLHSLGVLNLSENTALTDLSPISDLVNLGILNLSDCSSLRDISSLTNLPRLWRLYLNRCTMVDDLSPLFHLPQLEELYITGYSEAAEKQIHELRAARPELKIFH